MRVLENFINGAWVKSSGTTLLDVKNPATGEVLAKCPLSTAADVDRAVEAARAAFPAWAATPPVQRARYLFKLKDLFEKHKEEIAQICTSEHGKTLSESRNDFGRGIENVEHACGMPTLMMGQSLSDIAHGDRLRDDPPADGRLRGDHAVQLPADGPDVVSAVRDRDRQHLHLEAERAGAALAAPGLRADRRGRPPARRRQPGERRQGRRERALRAQEHRRRLVRRLDRRREARLRAVRQERQARPGARRRQELPRRDARRRPGTSRSPTSARVIYGCAGQRCLAGAVVVGVGDCYDKVQGRAPRRGEGRQARRRRQARHHDGPGRSRPRTRTRSSATSTAASRRAASSCSTGATRRSRATRTATGSGRRSSTT